MVDGKISRAERKLNSLRCILTTHQHDDQLLTHLIVLFAASVSSSSLAKASTATIANIGEQANITLAAVQANSKADSNAAASLAFVVTAERSNAVSPSRRADILVFNEQRSMTLGYRMLRRKGAPVLQAPSVADDPRRRRLGKKLRIGEHYATEASRGRISEEVFCC